jgi:hypothetical protein
MGCALGTTTANYKGKEDCIAMASIPLASLPVSSHHESIPVVLHTF